MPRFRVTASDGVRLSVNVSEQAPPGRPTVVLVHGYPDSSSMWEGVVAELAPRFRVVTYDVRGAGRSDKPSGRSAYHLGQLSQDLGSVIRAVRPEGRVHLLAHDWGSVQAWPAVTGDALRGRIASFTSISGPSLDHAGRWFRAQLTPSPLRLRNLLRQLRASWYIGFFLLPLLPELMWRSGVMRWMVPRMDRAARPPDTSDGVHGLALYRANMLSRPSRPARVPTDWGPDLRVRRITGTHWVTRSNPRLIADATAELVDHVEGGSASREGPAQNR
jgi:pimeloyl-ACP methyl ester carboxylesterase